MSSIDEFRQEVMSEPSLQAELSTLAGKSQDELIAGVREIAAKHGFTLAETDIRTAVELHNGSTRNRDLNEAELEGVTAASGCDPKLYLQSFF